MAGRKALYYKICISCLWDNVQTARILAEIPCLVGSKDLKLNFLRSAFRERSLSLEKAWFPGVGQIELF
jgi:hypothetical protein